MLQKIKNLLFPKTYGCLSCGRDIFENRYLFCNKCLPKLPHLDGRICLHCSEPLVSDGNYCKRCKGKNFICDRAISPFKYDGVIQSLIKKLKYDGHKYVAIALGKFMSDCFIKNKLHADVVVPVPLFDNRQKERGFNQAEELVNEFVKHTIIKTSVGNLIRTVDTPTQINLSFEERQKNLVGAFKINCADEFNGKSVLLVDDVYTTGATTNECCKILKSVGAKAVYVLTASHTVLLRDKEEENEL